MPLFKRRAQPAPAQPAPQPKEGPPVDRFRGDQQARQLFEEVQAGNWSGLHDFFEGTRDWDDREFYVAVLSEFEGLPDWLDEWRAARSDSSIPHLFRGQHMVYWAWQARGSGRGRTVGQDAARMFYERLVLADRELERAVGLDPADPTPLTSQLWVAIGLQLGQVELRRRFDELRRRDPWNHAGHMAMIQGFARKWGGSHDAMFDLARDTHRDAPDGHSVHTVICSAHLERWLDMSQFAEEKPHQTTYFRNAQVANEVQEAADRYIRSPAMKETKRTVDDRNYFAMCFRLIRDFRSQLEQMELIGDSIQFLPWAFQGNAGWAFERARTYAQEQLAQEGDAN